MATEPLIIGGDFNWNGGKQVSRTILTVGFLTIVATTIGCNTPGGGIFPAPGPIWHQQQQAVLHDPYPDTNWGPEIEGGRPRSYSHPQPEAARSKNFRESWWGRQ